MMPTRRRVIELAFIVGALAVFAYARAEGPDRGYTGAPDESDCTACHDTYQVANVGPGAVSIASNPQVYQPGTSYTLSVSVTDPKARRWGFELTAIDQNGKPAGNFAPMGSDTQIAINGGDPMGRQYIEHTLPGTFPGTSGGHTWQVQWTAPNQDIGAVRFFAAGNAANNDGTDQGDYIYTTSALSDSATSAVAVSLLNPPDGQTFPPGSSVLISWSVTNPAGVDGYDVRYSTDGGATFPITNLIFSSADSSATQTNWVVPTSPTSQAVIRVEASTVSGGVARAVSGKFTITSGGAGSGPPSITSAYNVGKHLYVNGANFQIGAIVDVNSADQKTINGDSPTSQLYCKKAAKSISPGETVVLTVRNPDGSQSEAYTFTRPAG